MYPASEFRGSATGVRQSAPPPQAGAPAKPGDGKVRHHPARQADKSQVPVTPSLPQYVTSKTFAHPQQQKPLMKMMKMMMKPRLHRQMKLSLKKTKKKHQVHFF